MKTLLTIIIPHRNSILTLRRMLDSIGNDRNVRIIVIDDKSKDGQKAGELSTEFPYAVFINNPGPDFNAGSARNYGLNYADSEWVFFADADDYFVRDGLSTILSSINKACAETDIIFFGLTSNNEIDNSVGKRHELWSQCIEKWHKNGDESGLRYRWTGPVGKAIRYDLIKNYQIKFDSLEASNDVLFSQLSGHRARNVACMTNVVYCITESNSSLTAALTPARALCRLDALTRRNMNFIKWKTPIRLDWGATYFFHSRPWSLNRYKLKVYSHYIVFLARRCVRLRHGIGGLSRVG
jgi:glycosyltransferase involved in cell wall biosynthesis